MSESLSRSERVGRYVDERARALQAAYHRDDSAAVADLARLRRGVGKHPSADVVLFGLATGDQEGAETTTLHAPGTHLSDEEPSREEMAAFAALTLFAMHQQSRRDASMHRHGYSMGRSARLLGRQSNARDAVRARFAALGTAASWDETLHHARGIIQQLRQHSIPLDYGRFARDLFDLRDPAAAQRVRNAWGRDFYRAKHPEDDPPEDDVSDGDARAASESTDD